LHSFHALGFLEERESTIGALSLFQRSEFGTSIFGQRELG